MKFNHYTLEDCHNATGIVLIIDVLRAFSTAAYAFSRGAKEIRLVSGRASRAAGIPRASA